VNAAPKVIQKLQHMVYASKGKASSQATGGKPVNKLKNG